MEKNWFFFQINFNIAKATKHSKGKRKDKRKDKDSKLHQHQHNTNSSMSFDKLPLEIVSLILGFRKDRMLLSLYNNPSYIVKVLNMKKLRKIILEYDGAHEKIFKGRKRVIADMNKKSLCLLIKGVSNTRISQKRVRPVLNYNDYGPRYEWVNELTPPLSFSIPTNMFRDEIMKLRKNLRSFKQNKRVLRDF